MASFSAKKAAVVSCSGPFLTPEERHLFKVHSPLGFILFQRSCDTPAQLSRLVQDLRDSVGYKAPILIDQEGGRVARLRPPHWPDFPPAGRFGAWMDQEPKKTVQAAFDEGRWIGHTLISLGIDVNCAPVCDIPARGAHDVIGDRAYGTSAHVVEALALAFAQGLMAEGVLPVMKHIPGHGRALVDSHHDLPVVDAPLPLLDTTDFIPFKNLAPRIPLGMTAHVVYRDIDPSLPGTLSPAVIKLIRQNIGFTGFLFSDDISMKALYTLPPSDSEPDIGQKALAAGVDCVLHCSGHPQDMEQFLEAIPPLTQEGIQRWQRASSFLTDVPRPTDGIRTAQTRFEYAMAEMKKGVTA